MGVDIIPSQKDKYDALDPLAFLYPWALAVADMLHGLWGGFETACKNSLLIEALLDVLTSIIAFASDTQLMRKLRATCCGDDPATQAAFKTKATVHIDDGNRCAAR